MSHSLIDTQAVLFDLDGTLADTAPDLAYALNQTLLHFGKQALAESIIRPAVSHGGIALIKLGFDLQPDDPGFEERRLYLLDVYLNNICRQTQLFDGMEVLLDALDTAGTPWGIVTNKPSWLTDPLIEAMQLPWPAGCVISGDTCKHNKPHPMPILHACKLLNVDSRKTLYVGDAKRDMQAGKAANNTTVCALFGYIQPEDDPLQWPADYFIKQPLELISLLAG